MIGSDRARGDFVATALLKHSELVDPYRRVTDSYAHLLRFRERHDLVRPSAPPRLLMLIALVLIFLLGESLLNAGLLGAAHEFGFLGGASIALIIAVANIAASGIFGWQIRWINRKSVAGKVRGYLTLAAFVMFALAFNLMVGHFRDAVEGAQEIMVAAREAFTNFWASFLGVESAMSWLLVLIGLVVSVGTSLKTYHSFDPYPGYREVEEMLSEARRSYNDELYDAIAELTEKRDQAIDALNEGHQMISSGLREGLDATQGQTALKGHLTAFLEQCDLRANQLLTIYRDANRVARSEPVPAHFEETFRFEPYRESKYKSTSLSDAQNELREIGKIVDAAIEAIGTEYDNKIRSFRRIDEVEGDSPETAASRRLRDATLAKHSNDDEEDEKGQTKRLAVVASKAEKA